VGRGGSCGVSALITAVHRSPNKLWRSNSIFNLWVRLISCCNYCPRFANSVLQSPNTEMVLDYSRVLVIHDIGADPDPTPFFSDFKDPKKILFFLII
jgi:hypothetical protein